MVIDWNPSPFFYQPNRNDNEKKQHTAEEENERYSILALPQRSDPSESSMSQWILSDIIHYLDLNWCISICCHCSRLWLKFVKFNLTTESWLGI